MNKKWWHKSYHIGGRYKGILVSIRCDPYMVFELAIQISEVHFIIAVGYILVSIYWYRNPKISIRSMS